MAYSTLGSSAKTDKGCLLMPNVKVAFAVWTPVSWKWLKNHQTHWTAARWRVFFGHFQHVLFEHVFIFLCSSKNRTVSTTCCSFFPHLHQPHSTLQVLCPYCYGQRQNKGWCALRMQQEIFATRSVNGQQTVQRILNVTEED